MIPRLFRGGDGGIRTLDLTDANRTLSQLSYAPKSLSYFIIFFGVCKDLFFKKGRFFGRVQRSAVVGRMVSAPTFYPGAA